MCLDILFCFFKVGNTEPNATHKNQLLLLDDLLTLLQKEGDFERKGLVGSYLPNFMPILIDWVILLWSNKK